jgi:PST family polysaccharide transporter
VATPLSDSQAESLSYEATKSRAVAGGKALLGRYAAVGLLSLGGSTALIRALGPADWAAFTIAYYVITWLDQTYAPRLLGRLIRAPEEPGTSELAAAARLMQIVGGGAALFIALISLPVGRLYGQDGLTYCLLGVAVCAYLYAVRSTSVAILERSFRYGRVAAADVLDQVVFYVVAVPLVLGGAGLVGVAVGLAARGLPPLLLLRRWAPAPLFGGHSREQLRKLLGFGLPAAGAGLVFLADGFVPALVLGHGNARELAFTMTAATIIGYAATTQVIVQRVGLPGFASLQADRARFGSALGRTLRMNQFVLISSVTPLAGTGVLWLPLLLGSEWRPAGLVMTWVGAGLLFNGFVSVIGPALSALGHPREFLAIQGLMTVSYLVLAMFAVSVSPLLGAAVAWAISRALGTALGLVRVAAHGYPVTWRAQTAVTVAAVGVLAAIGYLFYERHPGTALAVAVTAATSWLWLTRPEFATLYRALGISAQRWPARLTS